MMRPETRSKYTQAINQLIAEKRDIPLHEFNAISRQYFGNFVTMHYFRSAGLLNETGPKTYRINESIPPSIILKSYENYQHEVGLKAAKKHKLFKKIQKEMSQSSVKPEYRKEFRELQGSKNIKHPTISVAGKLLGNNCHTEKENASQLVEKLRNMGYEVTCRKVVEL